MFEFLFLDLDDTILDFHKAEQIAIQKTLQDFGITPTDTVCNRYSQINDIHWKKLEKGELTRDQVLVGRFAMLFRELGVDADPASTSDAYMEYLGSGHYFLPGAQEALQGLAKKYKLYLASNGTAVVQQKRLQSADIGKYFEQIFISQSVGYDKPAKGYFDHCFARISGFDRTKAMIVGDSLTSDIQGGINAGIATCWVNPAHKPCGEIRPDYQIDALPQLEALLEAIP